VPKVIHGTRRGYLKVSGREAACFLVPALSLSDRFLRSFKSSMRNSYQPGSFFLNM
jgi:hypothetical protein